MAVPAGFQLVDYETGQAPYNLTNFAWLGNGGLLTSGKDGTITFVPSGGAPRVLAQVPSVRAVGDHGLLGFALGNDYGTSGRVYVTYDKGDPQDTGFGMVEEWKALPADNPTSFTYSRTLIDGSRTSPQLAQTGPTHGIDSIVVAPDGTLFVSIGDDALNNGDPRTLRAQDLDQPYGKVLHLTPEGKGVPSNPYYSSTAPASWRSMVYASGFRNPFRFALDPRSGVPYLGDVGWRAIEEVNTLSPGANAGWPCYEGRQPTTFSTDSACQALYESGSALMPIWTYRHAGSQASVVGGVHYTGTSYPQQYRGAFFFGDYSRGQLWTMTTDTSGALTRSPESGGFAADAGGPVAFQTGPNGDVTYADILSSTVRRLVYTEGNRAPTARFTSTTDPDSRTVTFSAGDSYDLDGDALTYGWDLGDGTQGSGATVTHTYSSADPVQVTLTVADQFGSTDTASATVYPANHTPRLTLAPVPARTYAVGDLVELAATATDQEDGPLTVRWDTALKHCPFPNSCHLHPDDTVTGSTYSRPFTDHGADATMLVTVHAEDSHGAAAVATYEAQPTLRRLVVKSPVAISINGDAAPSAQLVAGSTVHVDAPADSYWRFRRWSDGGAPAHSFTMPDADLTLTAAYRSPIADKYTALGAGSSFLGGPTSAEYEVAGGRARNYTGGRLYWTQSTGAHEVHGPTLTKYLSGGGPAVLGFPTADSAAGGGGRAASFTKGHIYWSRTTGAHFLRGQILGKYLSAGGAGVLGFPRTDVVEVTGGRAAYFTKGRIYWSATTGAHVSRGAVLRRYLSAGGPDGYGFPETDTKAIGRGSYAHFTGGRSIFFSPATGVHLVDGRIRRKYAAMGYQRSCLGLPTSDAFGVTGGRRSRFAGGTITYLYTGGTTARCVRRR